MTERFDAIVIGAGHNGLVTGAYLARAGLSVLIIEASDAIGGMAAERKLGDCRFPGLAHLAYPPAASIVKDLELAKHGYAAGKAVGTVALDEAGAHRVIENGSIAGDGLSQADIEAYGAFRDRYLAFARALKPLFENRPPRLRHMDFPDKKALAGLGWNLRMGLGREDMYEFLRVAAINIYDVLNEAFEDERLKGALATDAVLGSAMGPRTPGTVLTWLQRIYGELNGPMCANTGQLVNALRRSAEGAGATLRTGTPVIGIIVEDGCATGVRLPDGETIRANSIVSAIDPRRTFGELVGAPNLDAMFANRVSQIRGKGVVGKLHLVLRDKPAFAGLSESRLADRLLIAPSMRYVEHAFNHSKYGEFSESPVLEITMPSEHDDTLVPEGRHLVSINAAYVPWELDGGWEGRGDAFAERVIAQVERYAPGLASLVEAREFISPAGIEAEYGAVGGHWHHGELAIHQSFMMRPLYGAARYDTPIDGLFLCGAGCHPGGGLTGLPGRNSARRVLEIGGDR